MDIYVTYLETGDSLRFPMLPEKVCTAMGNQFATYQVLGLGEVKIPSGTALDQVSWSGLLPGEVRKNDTYIKEWTAPLEVYKWLENVKSTAGTSKKLRLLITETSINIDVYLETLKGEFAGGQGDFSYEISFVQAKDLTVTATSSISTEVSDSSGSSGEIEVTVVESSCCCTRPEPPTGNTYTVVAGDFLWAIAQRFYGDGSKYGVIYAANQAMIDKWSNERGHEKYTIYPRQVLTIP